MDKYESLSHTKWECKYHVVFIPKCRRRTLYGSCESTWAMCYGNWQGRKKGGSKKGI